jgi:hypothetical protein
MLQKYCCQLLSPKIFPFELFASSYILILLREVFKFSRRLSSYSLSTISRKITVSSSIIGFKWYNISRLNLLFILKGCPSPTLKKLGMRTLITFLLLLWQEQISTKGSSFPSSTSFTTIRSFTYCRMNFCRWQLYHYKMSF